MGINIDRVANELMTWREEYLVDEQSVRYYVDEEVQHDSDLEPYEEQIVQKIIADLGL